MPLLTKIYKSFLHRHTSYDYWVTRADTDDVNNIMSVSNKIFQSGNEPDTSKLFSIHNIDYLYIS